MECPQLLARRSAASEGLRPALLNATSTPRGVGSRRLIARIKSNYLD